MAFDPLTAAFDIGKTLITRIWPDPEAQARELLKLEELKQKGEIAELNAFVVGMQGQLRINEADANSGNWFQSGWRPAIGWVGAISLALMYIPKSLVMTYIWAIQSLTILSTWDKVSNLPIPVFPDLGVSDIVGLILSMLGVAGMRSFDKLKGTDTKK